MILKPDECGLIGKYMRKYCPNESAAFFDAVILVSYYLNREKEMFQIQGLRPQMCEGCGERKVCVTLVWSRAPLTMPFCDQCLFRELERRIAREKRESEQRERDKEIERKIASGEIPF